MIGRRDANTSRWWSVSRTLHLWALLALGVAGCHPNADGHPPPSAQAVDSAQTGYVTPPRVTSAVRMDGGGVALTGRTEPEARIRLQSPDGAAYGVTASADGTWSLVVPAPQIVRLLGISEVVGSRAVQSMGYLAILPGSGQPAILLRAGGGSHTLGSASDAPWISVVDFDGGGGAVISGLGKPGAPVRVTVDGSVVGEARPDGNGRFSVTPPFALKPGLHQVEILSTSGQARAAFMVSTPAPLSNPSFVGQRQANDWRIDWLTPAGAPQITLAFDPPGRGGPQP